MLQSLKEHGDVKFLDPLINTKPLGLTELAIAECKLENEITIRYPTNK